MLNLVYNHRAVACDNIPPPTIIILTIVRYVEDRDYSFVTTENIEKDLCGGICIHCTLFPCYEKVIKHSFQANGLDKQLLTVRSQSSALYFIAEK